MRTAAVVPFTQLTEVFGDIERERNWEPSFPTRYLQLDAQNPHMVGDPASTIAVPNTAATVVSTLSSVTGTAASTVATQPHTPTKNTMVRNMSYRAASFDEFKAMGIRIGRLKDALRARNVKLPTGTNGQPMCLAFHVLGYCNERCNSAKDHIPHSEKDDKDLVAWCKEHYKME
jgi:hypothetical protein